MTTTADALAGYLAERGIIEAGDERESWYASRWFTTEVKGRRIPIFPMAGFRGGIALHDVHHMLTGYETSWRGECEVAGWELASGGCGWKLLFWLDRLGFFAIGLFAAPRRTLRAFRRGLSAHNLYRLDPERVLSMPLAEIERTVDWATIGSSGAPARSEKMDAERGHPAAKKRDWRRAWQAIMALVGDSSRTDQVFELLEALEGPTDEQAFREFADHPEGRKLLEEKPCLLDALSDRDRLRALPEGSFGRAYLAFVERSDLDAEGLVEADAAAGGVAERERNLDADRRWLADRGRDSHDLWHVLTGYGSDEAGETALLAFTYANYRNPGIAVILLAAVLIGPKTLRFQWERYLWQAYRRGARADLDFARYEDWLALPLSEVRQKAAIVPPERAHPGIGIVEGGREGGRGTAFLVRG